MCEKLKVGNSNRKKLFILMIFIIGILFMQNVSAISVTMHVPEKYNNVEAGERLYFELSVKYPENPSRVDLRLNYKVKDHNGNIIASSKALKAVETQASFIDFIVLPENVDSGIYTINVELSDYGDMNEVVSSSFQITGNKEQKIITYLYILIGGMIFLSMLVVVDIFRRK